VSLSLLRGDTFHFFTYQALVEGADQLPGLSMYEQGSGKLNLHKSMEILQVIMFRFREAEPAQEHGHTIGDYVKNNLDAATSIFCSAFLHGSYL
jgi:hypothetical protein